MTTATKPVDLYIRISRVGRRDREQLRAPDDQEREARRFATGRGLTVGEVISDIDVPGANLDRPGPQRALGRVHDGASGGIVAAYLSRTSRDAITGLELLDEITRAGGEVYAPNLPENYRSADGRMTTTIQLAIDEGYRNRKREELEAAKAGAIADGIHVGNRPPVGYRWKREESEGPGLPRDHRLVPDQDSAPPVAEVFERRASGTSLGDLATFLDDAGIVTSQGGAWTHQAVASVLRSRVYIGELSYGRPPRYVNTDAHEPLVDLATWQAAQSPASPAPRATAGDYALSGVVRCRACGYAMQPTRTSADRGRKRRYRCVRRHAGGTCPSPVSVAADHVEAVAERILFEVLGDLEASGSADRRDLSALEDALSVAEARLAAATSPDVQDAAGDAWADLMRIRREARDEAAQVLGHARSAASVPDTGMDATTLGESWPDLSVAERRVIFTATFDALAIGRDDAGLVLDAWRAGSGPVGLSRRGFREHPGLRPLDDRPAEVRSARL